MGDAFGNLLARTAGSAHWVWTSPAMDYCWGCEPKVMEISKSKLTLEYISWRTFTPKQELPPTFAFLQDRGDPTEIKRKLEVTSEISSRRRFHVGGHPRTKGRRAAKWTVGGLLGGWHGMMDTCRILIDEHENICKSQRTVMTMYVDRLGYMNGGIINIVITICNYLYK
jgi:hypothetical protein